MNDTNRLTSLIFRRRGHADFLPIVMQLSGADLAVAPGADAVKESGQFVGQFPIEQLECKQQALGFSLPDA